MLPKLFSPSCPTSCTLFLWFSLSCMYLGDREWLEMSLQGRKDLAYLGFWVYCRMKSFRNLLRMPQPAKDSGTFDFRHNLAGGWARSSPSWEWVDNSLFHVASLEDLVSLYQCKVFLDWENYPFQARNLLSDRIVGTPWNFFWPESGGLPIGIPRREVWSITTSNTSRTGVRAVAARCFRSFPSLLTLSS